MAERDLLIGCRAGDSRAAFELVRLHQDVVARVLLRIVGRRSIVEELVQETFLRLFRSLDRVDPERGARAWLLRTAVNIARDHVRRDAPPEEALPDGDALSELAAGEGDDPEKSAEVSERRRRLLAALAQLPAREREVVVLHYIEGLSFPDIAAVLHVSVSGLKMRALRARERLFSLVQEGSD